MSLDLDTNVTLRGEEELSRRAGHLFAGARERFVCAAADLHTWAMPGAREQIIAQRRRSAPDLAVHKLYNPRALADEESERRLVELARRGVHVRICTTPLPQETIIIDDRIAVLAGPPEQGVRAYTVVRSPGVIRGVSSLFWATWESAADLEAFRRTRPPMLNEESRAILRLLAEGLKDETASRRIGHSLRTYRRRVAEILTLLNADSRFQAALKARDLNLL
ncbi:DNA-binding response regulator [Spirillospora sp. NPDC047279]|uniref:DNA-binding response regulator n=1 Tax=Spirillospora sp. NPDC047279 TaxID=3155478 RepID=UPI0033E587C1